MKSLLTKITHKIKGFFKYIWVNKKKPRVFVSVIILIIILLFFAMPNAGASSYELKAVTPGEFIQEVAVTGKVTPAQKVDLGFEVGGRVSGVTVKVGQFVKKGTRLASISNTDYYASLQKSQAAYQGEQAKLLELQKGTRPEEIAIASSDVQVAAQNVEQAKLQLIEEIKDSYAKADDAVKNKADRVFRYPRSTNPELIFFVDGNPTLKSSLEFQRLRLTEQFPAWLKLVSTVSVQNISDAQATEAKKYLTQVQTFLNDLNLALTSTGQNLNQDASYESYRADIIIGRTNVNAAFQELNTALNNWKNNESAKARAEEQYNLKKSGSTAEEIAAQRAQANSAAAGISNASALLSKTIIIAPFDGIVTRVEYKSGESVGGAVPVITMMSDQAFEIETFVSETDVAKLKVGQIAKVTLDALGDAVIFDAIISQVDLSETIKDGIVTYKARFQFVTKDERIKSGLTANVVVETDRRADIIKVPQSAIVIVKGKKHVKVVAGVETEWSSSVDSNANVVPVVTGAIDRDGDIEIASGLSAGQTIIVRSASK